MILLGALWLTACGSAVNPEVQRAFSDVRVPVESCRERAPATVTAAQQRTDLVVLRRLFERGYAGYELAGDADRWDRAFREAEAAITAEPITPLELVHLLNEHVGFVDDNHVGLWIVDPEGHRRWFSSGGHQSAYIAAPRFTRTEAGWYMDGQGRRLLGCGERPANEVVRPVFDGSDSSVRHAIIPLSRTPLESIACRFEIDEDESEEALPLSRIELFDRRGPAFEELDAPFPWLRVRTLFPDRREPLDRFVASAERVRDAPVVVLDLRRGGGGSDRFLLRWFRRLTSESFLYWRTETLESEVTLQGARTFWGCVRAGSDADGAGSEWLDRRIARADRELEEAMRERGPFRDVEYEALELEGFAERPFDGRLILLIDSGCSSACETSVVLARQLPGAIIVGENTDGTMKVGELRFYRLPASGVWISLGTRVHREPTDTPTFQESVGFLPDLWLDGVDTDRDVRALAACLADEACAARGLDGSMRRGRGDVSARE